MTANPRLHVMHTKADMEEWSQPLHTRGALETEPGATYASRGCG